MASLTLLKRTFDSITLDVSGTGLRMLFLIPDLSRFKICFYYLGDCGIELWFCPT